MQYKLPVQGLAILPARYVRAWQGDRWHRVAGHGDSYEELSDEHLTMLLEDRLLDMHELFLCWDKASWDVSCAQFLMEPSPGSLALSRSSCIFKIGVQASTLLARGSQDDNLGQWQPVS